MSDQARTNNYLNAICVQQLDGSQFWVKLSTRAAIAEAVMVIADKENADLVTENLRLQRASSVQVSMAYELNRDLSVQRDEARAETKEAWERCNEVMADRDRTQANVNYMAATDKKVPEAEALRLYSERDEARRSASRARSALETARVEVERLTALVKSERAKVEVYRADVGRSQDGARRSYELAQEARAEISTLRLQVVEEKRLKAQAVAERVANWLSSPDGARWIPPVADERCGCEPTDFPEGYGEWLGAPHVVAHDLPRIGYRYGRGSAHLPTIG